ncbi:hypothetical protein [Thermoflavimicrobium daqui]|uniref:hypothetical protein n=1 Tax=Thermoflavimicrobium daqui TaxID=2137476 RepID=UPI0019819790|nr:hypothetical protein [Thermoflavimicrobium daqui]
MSETKANLGEYEINDLRYAALCHEFAKNIGRRTILIIPQFPFMVIGEIKMVIGDYLKIHVETTHISELEQKTLRLHINQIEVFFIEDGKFHIPSIQETTEKKKRRKD